MSTQEISQVNKNIELFKNSDQNLVKFGKHFISKGTTSTHRFFQVLACISIIGLPFLGLINARYNNKLKNRAIKQIHDDNLSIIRSRIFNFKSNDTKNLYKENLIAKDQYINNKQLELICKKFARENAENPPIAPSQPLHLSEIELADIHKNFEPEFHQIAVLQIKALKLFGALPKLDCCADILEQVSNIAHFELDYEGSALIKKNQVLNLLKKKYPNATEKNKECAQAGRADTLNQLSTNLKLIIVTIAENESPKGAKDLNQLLTISNELKNLVNNVNILKDAYKLKVNSGAGNQNPHQLLELSKEELGDIDFQFDPELKKHAIFFKKVLKFIEQAKKLKHNSEGISNAIESISENTQRINELLFWINIDFCCIKRQEKEKEVFNTELKDLKAENNNKRDEILNDIQIIMDIIKKSKEKLDGHNETFQRLCSTLTNDFVALKRTFDYEKENVKPDQEFTLTNFELAYQALEQLMSDVEKLKS